MAKFLFKITTIIFVISAVLSCRSSNRFTETNYGPVYAGDTIYFRSRPIDQSADFQLLLDQSGDMVISLDHNAAYQISDIFVNDNKSIQIIGNNSTIYPSKKTSKKPIITFVDTKILKISNCTISGGYPNSKVENYLIKVHTPQDKTTLIEFAHVDFIDGGGGALMVQNIFPKNPKQDYAVGADEILITDCSFKNVGLFSAINIRGSHKDVMIKDCFATDPLSRQHLSMGKMFECSAEVNVIEDEVGNVLFENCTIRDANKGFFAQKTKSVMFKNIRVDSLGHKPVYYDNGKPVGVVALKIDDLGYNNKAVLDSFYVTNTADLDYKVFLALEESPHGGHTSGVEIGYFESDAVMRLGASGNHKVLGGIMNGAEIGVISENNIISNVQFVGGKSKQGMKLLSSNNEVYNCTFEDSNIVIYKTVTGLTLKECSLIKSKTINKFIVFDFNNPQAPNELNIINCSVPDGFLGLWSGGVPKQSKNIIINLVNSPSIEIHKNIKTYGKVAIR